MIAILELSHPSRLLGERVLARRGLRVLADLRECRLANVDQGQAFEMALRDLG